MIRRNTGFTLIEVMVALLVLSVGMIGVAALHGQALAASGTAIYRSQAINLAGSIADRIRANRLARAAYAGPTPDNPFLSLKRRLKRESATQDAV